MRTLAVIIDIFSTVIASGLVFFSIAYMVEWRSFSADELAMISLCMGAVILILNGTSAACLLGDWKDES